VCAVEWGIEPNSIIKYIMPQGKPMGVGSYTLIREHSTNELRSNKLHNNQLMCRA